MTVNIDSRWLFVKTCHDLLTKSRSPDYYDKLRMAGLVRHLVVGPRSLLAMTNREPALPLEFWFREPGDDVASWEGPAGFDASRRQVASGVVRREGLDAFLGARVVHCHEWLTVEQLLTTVAHAYGGFLSDVPHGLSREAQESPEEVDDGAEGAHAVVGR